MRETKFYGVTITLLVVCVRIFTLWNYVSVQFTILQRLVAYRHVMCYVICEMNLAEHLTELSLSFLSSKRIISLSLVSPEI